MSLNDQELNEAFDRAKRLAAYIGIACEGYSTAEVMLALTMLIAYGMDRERQPHASIEECIDLHIRGLREFLPCQ